MANTNSVQHEQLAPQNGALLSCWGTREIATANTINDTITFFTIPAGTTVHGGWLRGDDLDTGTEAIEIDIGDASSATRFLDSGVITGDAITGTKPEVGIATPLFGTLKDGPYTYTADTNIIGTITAAAAAGGTGTLTLWMWTTYQDPRVSPPNKPL
jgi:hypothetical protein